MIETDKFVRNGNFIEFYFTGETERCKFTASMNETRIDPAQGELRVWHLIRCDRTNRSTANSREVVLLISTVLTIETQRLCRIEAKRFERCENC